MTRGCPADLNNFKLLKLGQACTKAVIIVAGCRLKDDSILILSSNDLKNKNIKIPLQRAYTVKETLKHQVFFMKITRTSDLSFQ